MGIKEEIEELKRQRQEEKSRDRIWDQIDLLREKIDLIVGAVAELEKEE